MNIHEYQAKQLLAKYGVAVLKGGVRGADIGLGGDAHAEEAREDRAAGTGDEAQSRGKINENGDQDKQDKNKNSQNLIF